MPYSSRDEPEYEDYDEDDGDWPDDDSADWSEDEDEPTVPCPYCGAEIHEDAQRCPRCERYISDEDRLPARKPWWILIGVAAVLYIIYRWLTPW